MLTFDKGYITLYNTKEKLKTLLTNLIPPLFYFLQILLIYGELTRTL
ncbi:hypothetical protein M2419_000629 [Sphingobacterium sp. BIGb0116]|nr:hypothetical protein [Sphingobacterium sp. BIGb0116]